MSLRARVLVGGLVITLLLAGAAAVIIQVTEAHLIERVDGQLQPRATGLEVCGAEVMLQDAGLAGGTTVRTGSGDQPQDGRPCATPGPGAVENEVVTQGWAETVAEPAPAVGPVQQSLTFLTVVRVTPDGVEPLVEPGGQTFVQSSGPTPESMGPEIDEDEALAAAESGEPFTTGSPDTDVRWRARAVLEEDTGTLLVVAQPLTDVDATVEQLVVIEIIVTLVILAALGLVAWWVDRHGIRPVKRMTATASAIAAGDLSPRVPEAAPGTEAGQLGGALNQMLGRLEEAFDERARSEARLRQFVADASHELRTPVTTIRGYSELYESGGLEDDEELSEAMRRTREEAVRMGSLVDDLLLLARLDQGPVSDPEAVDLADLVRDAGRDARAVDPDRVITTSVGDGSFEVPGDRDQLRQVLGNLVGNALVHTPSSAELHISARREATRLVVEVADEGPGMPPEVARHVFERFFRADPSRSRHRGGSGLGLSIVQACVDAHGGEVRLDSRPGEGTTVKVSLPVRSLPADSQVAHGVD